MIIIKPGDRVRLSDYPFEIGTVKHIKDGAVAFVEFEEPFNEGHICYHGNSKTRYIPIHCLKILRRVKTVKEWLERYNK